MAKALFGTCEFDIANWLNARDAADNAEMTTGDTAVGGGVGDSTMAVAGGTAVDIGETDDAVTAVGDDAVGVGRATAIDELGAAAAGLAAHSITLDGSEISKQRRTDGVDPWYVSHSDTAGDSGAASADVGAGGPLERGGGENEQNFSPHWC
jgi:hypothetical protein